MVTFNKNYEEIVKLEQAKNNFDCLFNEASYYNDAETMNNCVASVNKIKKELKKAIKSWKALDDDFVCRCE